MSLEEWATSNDKMILAVTKDSDWKAFADKSQRIDVIDDLAKALELFQEHAEEANKIIQILLEGIFNNKYTALSQTLSNLLHDTISGYPVYAEADSYLHVEGEDVQLDLLDYQVSGNPEFYNFVLVQAGPKKITIQLEFITNVKASAGFSFSVHDSVDDDYVGMGSTEAEIEEQIEITTLITFEGDFEKEMENNITMSSLEIIQGPDVIDFGEVNPDYSNEYYDE